MLVRHFRLRLTGNSQHINTSIGYSINIYTVRDKYILGCCESNSCSRVHRLNNPETTETRPHSLTPIHPSPYLHNRSETSERLEGNARHLTCLDSKPSGFHSRVRLDIASHLGDTHWNRLSAYFQHHTPSHR